MSIFTLIKKYFSSQSNNKKTNSINICLLDNGFFAIDFNIQDTSKISANHLAEILFKINDGKLYDDMVNSMIDYAKDNQNNSEFMLYTIYSWGLLIKKKNSELDDATDDPLIKPSRVFSIKN